MAIVGLLPAIFTHSIPAKVSTIHSKLELGFYLTPLFQSNMLHAQNLQY